MMKCAGSNTSLQNSRPSSVGASGPRERTTSRVVAASIGTRMNVQLPPRLVSRRTSLPQSDGAASDMFGVAVSVSPDTLVVGAHGDDTPGGTNAGSAYVFVRSGTTWTQQAQLFASDGAEGDGFGYSVALSGDTALVGASEDDTPGGLDAGSAYVFWR